MKYFWHASLLVGVTLQVLLISVLLGFIRQFRILFGFLVLLFLTTVADYAAFLGVGSFPDWYLKYFWINNLALQLAIFLLVLSFISRAAKDLPTRAGLIAALAVGAIVIGGCSAYFNYSPIISQWMTTVARNLSFYAVVMNLVLWGVLIRQHGKDQLLLSITGGLGIQMAGEAIGQSIRQLSGRSANMVLAGNLVLVLSHLLCLYIWWNSFRRARAVAAAKARHAG